VTNGREHSDRWNADSLTASKHDTPGALDIFEVSIPANIRMPVPHHHRDWEKTVYGMEGTTTFMVAGNRVNVAPGETLFIRAAVIHGFVNDTEGPTKMLCVLTPSVLSPEYFREMGIAMEGPAPPDPKKLRRDHE
jgi:quercetin dioxygenase-like cupin family protein